MPKGSGEARKQRRYEQRAHWAERKDAYGKYLLSPEWQHRRRAALRRDGHRCLSCGTRKLLQVHHRTYVRFRDELPSDLVTVCQRCHAAIHRLVRGSVTVEAATDRLVSLNPIDRLVSARNEREARYGASPGRLVDDRR